MHVLSQTMTTMIAQRIIRLNPTEEICDLMIPKKKLKTIGGFIYEDNLAF